MFRFHFHRKPTKTIQVQQQKKGQKERHITQVTKYNEETAGQKSFGPKSTACLASSHEFTRLSVSWPVLKKKNCRGVQTPTRTRHTVRFLLHAHDNMFEDCGLRTHHSTSRNVRSVDRSYATASFLSLSSSPSTTDSFTTDIRSRYKQK